MTDFLWKIMVLVLLGALAGVGGRSWMTSHKLNKVREELATEKNKVADLQAAITTQNEAIENLAAERERAELRAKAAWEAASSKKAKTNSALDKSKNSKAQSCAEAMPTINQILDGLK